MGQLADADLDVAQADARVDADAAAAAAQAQQEQIANLKKQLEAASAKVEKLLQDGSSSLGPAPAPAPPADTTSTVSKAEMDKYAAEQVAKALAERDLAQAAENETTKILVAAQKKSSSSSVASSEQSGFLAVGDHEIASSWTESLSDVDQFGRHNPFKAVDQKLQEAIGCYQDLIDPLEAAHLDRRLGLKSEIPTAV